MIKALLIYYSKALTIIVYRHKWYPRRSIFWIITLLFWYSWNAFADDQLAWFENGQPTIDAIQAVQILQSAEQDGLDPDDYQASFLARIVNDTKNVAPSLNGSDTEHSALMTQAMEQFISDLHFGRVDPLAIYPSFKMPPKQLDY